MLEDLIAEPETLAAPIARSPRVELRVPVHVRQEGPHGREWFAVAASVNRAGGLLRSPVGCAPASRIRIMNTETGEAALFRVVWSREYVPGRHELGVALMVSRPSYWGASYETLVSS